MNPSKKLLTGKKGRVGDSPFAAPGSLKASDPTEDQSSEA